jgi:RHS repeat-associated protein
VLGFTGQLRDSFTGCYHLGNGHRTYNPVLMRFHSADRLSPFGKGGINAYAYCQNDPVNFHDPSGRFPSIIAPIRSIIGGFMNLAISTVKAYRGYMTERSFRPVPEHAGSQSGELTYGIPETDLVRWSTKDKVLGAVGAFTATVSIGTGIGRLSGADAAPLAWIDTTVSMIATSVSAYELYRMATAPVLGRFPVEVVSSTYRRAQSPAQDAGSIRRDTAV